MVFKPLANAAKVGKIDAMCRILPISEELTLCSCFVSIYVAIPGYIYLLFYVVLVIPVLGSRIRYLVISGFCKVVFILTVLSRDVSLEEIPLQY